MRPSAGDRIVLTGISWAGGPSIRLRHLDEASSVLEPLVGLQLNYQASPASPRHCLGHTPFRSRGPDHVDCSNPPEPGSRKCRACSIVDATFASNLHHAHTKGQAELDPAIVEHLQQPNVLYLAGFRDGSVKIGTSTEQRSQKRLTEQGAWRAILVGTFPNGYAVRKVEDMVTDELGIPQSVSIGRKVAGMAQPQADHVLESQLAGRHQDVLDLLATKGDTKLDPMGKPWSFPGNDNDVWVDLHPYPLRLESGAHDIEVVAACGRLVVVQRPGSDDRFVADIGRLYGVELEIGDFPSDELAVQDSLF